MQSIVMQGNVMQKIVHCKIYCKTKYCPRNTHCPHTTTWQRQMCCMIYYIFYFNFYVTHNTWSSKIYLKSCLKKCLALSSVCSRKVANSPVIQFVINARLAYWWLMLMNQQYLFLFLNQSGIWRNCGFSSNWILHYFPLSVRPCVCHRRGISHFSHI